MSTTPPTPPGLCLSRRALLGALGATGVAASLTACQADEPAAPTGGAAQPPPAPATSAPAAAPTDPATAAPTVAARPVLSTTAAIPVGGGKIVSGLLIVQPVAGTFAAYDARCPHLGAPLSTPQDGVVTCDAHNSTFRDVNGARLGGPAPRGLRRVPITVQGESITLSR